MRKLAKHYPIRSYFTLAFAISWVGSLIVGGAKFLRGEPLKPNDLWLMGLFMAPVYWTIFYPVYALVLWVIAVLVIANLNQHSMKASKRSKP